MKRFLHKLIHFIILPCNEASFIVEKQLHQKLSLKEQLQLKVHLHFCKMCLDYNKKSAAIHFWLQRMFLGKELHNIVKADELTHFKNKLKERLQAQP